MYIAPNLYNSHEGVFIAHCSSSFIHGLFSYRNDQNTEAMSKAHAIEDLHSRLKSNVESIQQLNQQVSRYAYIAVNKIDHDRIFFFNHFLGLLKLTVPKGNQSS